MAGLLAFVDGLKVGVRNDRIRGKEVFMSYCYRFTVNLVLVIFVFVVY